MQTKTRTPMPAQLGNEKANNRISSMLTDSEKATLDRACTALGQNVSRTVVLALEAYIADNWDLIELKEKVAELEKSKRRT